MRRFIGLALAVVVVMIITGCNDEGKVIQGRVIAYDKENKKVTFIEDKSIIKGKPEYTLLPPVVFTTPEDKNEMGAHPSVGQRMKLDVDKNTINIFDTATQQFKEIAYTLIERKDNVSKESPLVRDKKFPIVDKNAKTIQIFSKRQKILVTFSLPEEYFSLPDETWAAGDEVRIYYKEPGKALRMMNITTTDLFKK
ncbi:lipoprotein [Candidatus Magnetoovum chiemensis]|nr:lipoprotein [Candidatus Magnetoovum chiemensis]